MGEITIGLEDPGFLAVLFTGYQVDTTLGLAPLRYEKIRREGSVAGRHSQATTLPGDRSHPSRARQPVLHLTRNSRSLVRVTPNSNL